MGEAINNGTAAGNASVSAMQARTQGTLARNQAYQRAYDLESVAAAQNVIAADNMMTLRQNEAAAVGGARAAAGASGLSASSGSMLRAEQSVAEQFDVAVANLQRSAAISDQSARYQAAVTRSEGEQQKRLAEIQAAYYDKVSRINRNAFWPSLIGSSLTKGADIYLRFFANGAGGGAGDGAGGGAGGSGGGK